METSASSLDGDWESICKLLAFEDLNSSSCFLDDSLDINIQADASRLEVSSANIHDQNNAGMPTFSNSEYCLSDVLTPNVDLYSQESNMSYSGNEPGQFLLLSGHMPQSMDYCRMDRSNDDSVIPVCAHGSSIHQFDNGAVKCGSDDQASPGYDVQLERRSINPEMEGASEDQTMALLLPTKRSRVTTNGDKGKRKMRRKDPYLDGESEPDKGLNGHSSSIDISDNETDVYPKASRGANSAAANEPQGAGKRGAGRGAATDPQSLYARRRRERINERLRILQTLIPNGTKVDISTMLEEAVRYVKFLQLQIKLLSSDEHWMFAPLAYNGVNIGLYQKMSPVIIGP